jgi:DNA-binding NarL/FixJ family response regulator
MLAEGGGLAAMARVTSEEPHLENAVHSDEVPSAADREMLRLLASGATHETVARHLDIPLRTFRRRIAALMRLLGAVSPFQAGAEAARRGWLVGPGDERVDRR